MLSIRDLCLQTYFKDIETLKLKVNQLEQKVQEEAGKSKDTAQQSCKKINNCKEFLENKIERLEDKNRKRKGSITDLIQKNRKRKESITELEEENWKREPKISSLEEEVEEMKKHMNQIIEKIGNMETQLLYMPQTGLKYTEAENDFKKACVQSNNSKQELQ
jgi:predicted  nucleic acid-binding Zn-ribbon protein